MHLIVFPLILYLMVVAPILLLWPQRGLSGRNYWISVFSAMAGLTFGFALMIALREYVYVGALMYAMFFVVPVIFSLFSVLKFGNVGRSVAKPESLLVQKPRSIAISFLAATLSGLFLSILCALLLGIDGGYIFMAFALLFPITIIISLIKSGRTKETSPSKAVKGAIISSLIALAVSLLLGPYFILGLPVVLYSLVGTFVFLYVIFKQQKNLTSAITGTL